MITLDDAAIQNACGILAYYDHPPIEAVVINKRLEINFHETVTYYADTLTVDRLTRLRNATTGAEMEVLYQRDYPWIDMFGQEFRLLNEAELATARMRARQRDFTALVRNIYEIKRRTYPSPGWPEFDSVDQRPYVDVVRQVVLAVQREPDRYDLTERPSNVG